MHWKYELDPFNMPSGGRLRREPLITFVPYRLPDGRLVHIDADLARGATLMDFTLADGTIVHATKEPTR